MDSLRSKVGCENIRIAGLADSISGDYCLNQIELSVKQPYSSVICREYYVENFPYNN